MKSLYKKSVLVEITLPVGPQTIFPFPDVPFLRNKKISAINLSVAAKGLTSGLNNIATLSVLQISAPGVNNSIPAFVTFQDYKGVQFIQNLPIIELNSTSISNVNTPASDFISVTNTNGTFEIIPREINFEKSYITFPFGIPVTDWCLMFDFIYDSVPLPIMKKDIYYKTLNFEFVSLKVLAANSKYYFPDLPNLRNVKIQRINFYTPNILKTDLNKVLNMGGVSNNIFDGCHFLTLNKGGTEIVKNLEAVKLTPFSGNNTPYALQGSLLFDNVEVDFSQSYMEVALNTPAIAFPYSYCFGIFYTK